MDIQEILQKSDSLFLQSQDKVAIDFLEESLSLALESDEWKVALSVINELMGCYRNRSIFDRATQLSKKATDIIDKHGISDNIHATTTYMNIATLLRAKGELNEALLLYKQVEQSYLNHGLNIDTRLAGLYNNMAVVYIQLENEKNAHFYATRAIEILENMEDSADHRATVYCNVIQALLMNPNRYSEKIDEYLNKAYDIFVNECPNSVHFGAYWGLKGRILTDRKEYENAIASFEKSKEEIKKHFGENSDYKIMDDNIRILHERLNK